MYWAHSVWTSDLNAARIYNGSGPAGVSLKALIDGKDIEPNENYNLVQLELRPGAVIWV